MRTRKTSKRVSARRYQATRKELAEVRDEILFLHEMMERCALRLQPLEKRQAVLEGLATQAAFESGLI